MGESTATKTEYILCTRYINIIRVQRYRILKSWKNKIVVGFWGGRLRLFCLFGLVLPLPAYLRSSWGKYVSTKKRNKDCCSSCLLYRGYREYREYAASSIERAMFYYCLPVAAGHSSRWLFYTLTVYLLPGSRQQQPADTTVYFAKYIVLL